MIIQHHPPDFYNEDNAKKNSCYPLSFSQKLLWFIHNLGGKAQSAYNESLVFSLEGYLSISALQEALDATIKKNDILRVSFDKDKEGNLFQCLNSRVNKSIEMIEKISYQDLSDFISHEIEKPFDLTLAPLMRLSVFTLSETKHILIIIQHHIITDGMSSVILLNDLCYFYNQRMRGEDSSIPEYPPSYFDYIFSENNNYLTQDYQKKIEAVAKSLQGFSGLNFLTTPIIQEQPDTFSGDRVYFSLDTELCTMLRYFSKAQKVTLFNFLFATYCVFLNKYTRNHDIVVGVPFINRKTSMDRHTMGLFTNMLPIRMTVDVSHRFIDFLQETKSHILFYLDNQDVVFEHVASKLNLSRKTGGQHPLIQTMFAYSQSKDLLSLNFDGMHFRLEQGYFAKNSKFDLSLFMMEDNQETINAYFEFREGLFDRSTVERFAKNFVGLIKNSLQTPNIPLRSISMIDAIEKNGIKEKFFRPQSNKMVTKTLSILFSETAKRYSNRFGLVFENNKYDYEMLEIRTNQWAYYLRLRYRQEYDCDMPRDTLIGLCVDRCEDMILGMLGIIKSGAAYVPIDPRYPKDRIDYMLTNSKVSLLLTHQVYDEMLQQFPAKHKIFMDDKVTEQSTHPQPKTALNLEAHPEDIVYVLYTSGSTGKPKGVSVSHENVICLFEALKKEFTLSEQDVWSLFHTFCFDISVWEIWGAFLFGGTLVVIPFDTCRDPKKFYTVVQAEQVTVLTQTPSAFQMFITEDLTHHKKLTHLRYVAFVGESLKVSILRPWVEKYGAALPTLANMYGITETTVFTNYKFINQNDIDKGRDNIGWPLENFSMCILDDDFQWCPIGVIGEIYIGGRGLSRGYLYREDLTREKFMVDPHAAFLDLKKNARLYRTGDLGRWMEDGSVEYLGRKDFQIKLRGFRIELGEIESALGSYGGISQMMVLLKGENENAHLVAYYTLKSDEKLNVAKLTLHLKSFLPEYMIPNTFVELPFFPMNMNGKVDRQALYAIKGTTLLSENNLPLHTELEYAIAEVWSQVLQIDIKKIGISSSFFELGGNSLLVIKMLSLVSQQIGKEFSVGQFMGVPTIACLVEQTENRDGGSKSTYDFLKQLKTDATLNLTIQPLQQKNPHIFHPNHILITGATGFVGAHLLHELLETTSAKIYCLVRAPSHEEALKKINEKSMKYELSSHLRLNRIIPILGNLDQKKLGLSEHDFSQLSHDIDSIYHVGALVHHIYDYKKLYKTNVQSTVEILNMATCKKNKALHFISTLGAACISPFERIPLVKKGSKEAILNLNGYLLSKWISEQLLKEASHRGIVAHIYRPGNIIAGMRGIYEPDTNHVLLRLKGILQLGKAYIDENETLEMMPVDLLVSALVNVSKSPKAFFYNMSNKERISWVDYVKLAVGMGYNVSFLKNAIEWNTLIESLDEKNSLYALSSLHKKERVLYEQSDWIEQQVIPNWIIFTPSYKEMIESQILSLIRSGFLNNPNMKHHF